MGKDSVDDDIALATDSITSSIGKLSAVMDSMDNQSFDVKHTTFEMDKAIKKLNENITNFEKRNVRESFTDMMSDNRVFTWIIILVMSLLTLYYFMYVKNNNNKLM